MSQTTMNGVEGVGADALARLREQLGGLVVTPADPGWDLARQAWNLLADQHPLAVVQAGDVDDVAVAVRVAHEHGLRITAQATGHGALSLAALDDTVLIQTGALRDVAVDAGTRRARVAPGTTWDEVAEAAAEHGLAALAGSAGDVGVVGYSLGGGLGWLARRHGLAADAVTAIELVTVDGRPLRVDADHEPELFFGLRGGDGGFGIVTAMELELFPVPELTAGALFFPVERAGEVLRAWREWTHTVPESVTSIGRIMRFPPFPEVPEPLRGGAFVIVELASLADLASTEALVAPLRAREPVMDTIAEMAPPALAGLHMDPPEPAPGLSTHRLLDDGGAAMIDRLVEVAGPDAEAAVLSVELRHLGGALRRPPQGHGAVGALAADFALFAVTMADPADDSEARRALRLVADALAPWDAGRAYANFVDEPGDPRPLFDDDTVARLRALKAAWDPDDRMVCSHPLPSPPSSR